MTKDQNTESDEDPVEVFGRGVANVFDRALKQARNRINPRNTNPHDHFLEHISTLKESDRLMLFAQDTLEIFLHDIMFFFEESDEFKIVGKSKSGEEVDIKQMCPEGLHGQQLDWLEQYGSHENVEHMLSRLYPFKG